MSRKYRADLHIHTTFSDGSKTVDEVVADIAGLKDISSEEILEKMNLGKVRDLLVKSERLEDLAALEESVKKSAGIAKSARTFCKLDHDTLLGTEEFIDAMQKSNPESRVVVGSEMTTIVELPYVGDYAMHVPVLFYDDNGFDMMARSDEDRRRFFREIEDKYLDILNWTADANNHRRLEVIRKKCNEHFFDGEEKVTADQVVGIAKERIEKHIGERSIFNLDNHHISLFQTDIAKALAMQGVEGTPEQIAHRYFRREGELYVPLSRNEHTMGTEELLEEFGRVSGSSSVKVKRGIAHPSTYVRFIAKTFLSEIGLDSDQFYNEFPEKEASKLMYDFVIRLAKKGLVDFIESDYPRYTRNPPGPDKEHHFGYYMNYLNKESDFANRQMTFWRKAAECLGIATSGGSDSHFRKGTPMVGCGFGEIDFTDDKVDYIFSKK